MKEHIEGEPPKLEAFVRPVDEDTVDRYWTRGIHLALCHGVISEEAQLKIEREEKKKEMKRGTRLMTSTSGFW